MLVKSVPTCYCGVGLVTEDAVPRVGKSTNHGQLPDIWKLPIMLELGGTWSGAHLAHHRCSLDRANASPDVAVPAAVGIQ
jgi:hypothetical protein